MLMKTFIRREVWRCGLSSLRCGRKRCTAVSSISPGASVGCTSRSLRRSEALNMRSPSQERPRPSRIRHVIRYSPVPTETTPEKPISPRLRSGTSWTALRSCSISLGSPGVPLTGRTMILTPSLNRSPQNCLAGKENQMPATKRNSKSSTGPILPVEHLRPPSARVAAPATPAMSTKHASSLMNDPMSR